MASEKPFTQDQITLARQVPLLDVLDSLGAYVKQDREFKPTAHQDSIRVEVNLQGRHFRFVFTGEKWLNDLMDRAAPKRGGGGAIDFYQHITGSNFLDAVTACLAIATRRTSAGT